MIRIAGALLLLGIFASLPASSRGEHKYAFSVAPAGPPTPLARYLLLPDPRDSQPGNAAALYYRTEAMFVENSFLLKELREPYWYEWPSLALAELPQAEVEKGVNQARHFIRELEVAARQRHCDWNLDGREEGIALLIPDVQGFRMFANLLAVKARLHIARKQYPEAIKAIQTGYALGVHVGKGPTLIHMLVGIAIVNVLTQQLDTLLQQPDAPNLYWAIRLLPAQLFDTRHALRQEADALERSWPFLARLEKNILTAEEIQAGMAQLDAQLQSFGVREPALKNVARSAAIVSLHGAARTWLLENGFTKERIAAMHVVQAVTLYVYKRYRTAYDEWLVWGLANESESHPGMKAAQAKANEAGAVLDRIYFTGLLAGLGDFHFVPHLEKLNTARLRVERRFVGLATVEALRLQAAKNGGRWPEKADDVTAVPLPLDPVTRKPWDFQRAGEWITLTSPLAPGEKATSQTHFLYRVGLREK